MIKKIKGLTVKIYGLCSGVKGDVKKLSKWLKFLKQKKNHMIILENIKMLKDKILH